MSSVQSQSGGSVARSERFPTSKFNESRYKPNFEDEDADSDSATSYEREIKGKDDHLGRGLYLSREIGTGDTDAKSDFNDQAIISKFDSSARTTFDIKDLKNISTLKKEKWNRLHRWQRGTKPNWDGYGMEDRQSHSERINNIYKKSSAGALCDSIRMNKGEREMVVYLSTRLDYVDFGAHSDILKGILGTMAVIAETRRQQYGIEDPKKATLRRQSEFRELMQQVGIDSSGLKTVKRKIRAQQPWLDDL